MIIAASVTAHAQLIFKKLLACCIRCFIHFLPICTTYQSGILGQGGGRGVWKQGQQSKKSWKNSVDEQKILDYFRSINCINVSIHGFNGCKTGIEVSKCVYLASMAVKIEHTIGGIIMELPTMHIWCSCEPSKNYPKNWEYMYMLLSIETYLQTWKINKWKYIL